MMSTPSQSEVVADNVQPRSAPSILDLELLHHYTTSTYKTLSDIFESGDSLWQVRVVQEGLRNEFLLNGIFFLAAIHVSRVCGGCHSRYKIKASEYLKPALRTFRQLLRDLQVRNVDAMFAFAVILTVSMIVQLQPSTHQDSSYSSLIDRVAVVFEYLHGARKIVVSSSPILYDGPFGSFLSGLLRKEGKLSEPELEDGLLRLRRVHEEKLLSATLSASQQQLYSELIENLESCWLRRIFAVEWLNDAGKAFQVELQKGESVAKLLLAYWGAALHALDQLWWARGVGRHVVEQATQDLGVSSTAVEESVQWARQRVGLECREQF